MKARAHQFRLYNDLNSIVAKTYEKMHTNQTSQSASIAKNRFTNTESELMKKSLLELFPILDTLIDESDPDTHVPQIYHAYQTGEALRKNCDINDPTQLRKDIRIASLFGDEWKNLPSAVKLQYPPYLHMLYPEIQDWSWLPLVGFLHDMGKVLASTDWGSLPQWQTTGDTFPLKTPFSKANIFYDAGFFKSNPDLNYKSSDANHFGQYPKHCGLNKLQMAFGHDEYMFLILNNNLNKLPMHALYIIRFHSFYPWHTPRNGERGYMELANKEDWRLLPLLKLFQKSDLYSKTHNLPNTQELEKYYLSLLEKFVPIASENNAEGGKLKMNHLENDQMPAPSATFSLR